MNKILFFLVFTSILFGQVSVSEKEPGNLYISWIAPVGMIDHYTIQVSPGDFKQAIPTRNNISMAVRADSDYTVSVTAHMVDGTREVQMTTGHSSPYLTPIVELASTSGGIRARKSTSDGGIQAYLVYNFTAIGNWVLVVNQGGVVTTYSLPGIISNDDPDSVYIALKGSTLYLLAGRSIPVCYRFNLTFTPLTATLLGVDTLTTSGRVWGIMALASGKVVAWIIAGSTATTSEFKFFYYNGVEWLETDTSVAASAISGFFSSRLVQAPWDGSIRAYWNTESSQEIYQITLTETGGPLGFIGFLHVVSYLDGAFATQPDETWISAIPFGNQIAIAYTRFDVTKVTNTTYALEAVQSASLGWVENENAALVGLVLLNSGDARQFIDFPVRNRWIADQLELTVHEGVLAITYRPLDNIDGTFQELYSSDYLGSGWGVPTHLGTLSSSQINHWMVENGIVLINTPVGDSKLIIIPILIPPPPPPCKPEGKSGKCH